MSNKYAKKVTINGTEIFMKDADAREAITELTTRTEALENNVHNISEDVMEIESDLNTLSGSIEDLDDRVDVLSTAVKPLTNVITICDSYGTDNYETPNLCSVLCGLLGLEAGVSFRNYSRGSASFSANGGQPSSAVTGLNFRDILNYAIQEMIQIERNAVSDIIICGGANDYGADAGSVIAVGIEGFVATARQAFPNAKIHAFLCGWSNSENRYNYQNNYAMYRRTFSKLGCQCEYVFSVIVPRSKRISDGVHPTASGHEDLAYSIHGCLNGNKPLFPTQVYPCSNDSRISAQFIDEETVCVMSETVDTTIGAITVSSNLADVRSIENEIIEGYSESKFGFSGVSTIVATDPSVIAYNVQSNFYIRRVNNFPMLSINTFARNEDGSFISYSDIIQIALPKVSVITKIFNL